MDYDSSDSTAALFGGNCNVGEASVLFAVRPVVRVSLPLFVSRVGLQLENTFPIGAQLPGLGRRELTSGQTPPAVRNFSCLRTQS